MKKTNGMVYDGNWHEGSPHGMGKEYHLNGLSYEGEYVNGMQ